MSESVRDTLTAYPVPAPPEGATHLLFGDPLTSQGVTRWFWAMHALDQPLAKDPPEVEMTIPAADAAGLARFAAEVLDSPVVLSARHDVQIEGDPASFCYVTPVPGGGL